MPKVLVEGGAMNIIYVFLGGGLGAVSRYLLSQYFYKPENSFPLPTLFINILGAFLIGLVSALGEKHNLNPKIIVFLKVGLCGGFTTFSTFSMEAFDLLQKGKNTMAFSYMILSIVLCLASIFVAHSIVK